MTRYKYLIQLEVLPGINKLTEFQETLNAITGCLDVVRFAGTTFLVYTDSQRTEEILEAIKHLTVIDFLIQREGCLWDSTKK